MTAYHRHAYPVPGPSGEHALSTLVFPDGHDGPCDNRHPVVVLDPRDPETLRPLQRALDDQPHAGLQAMLHAVDALCGERVS